MYYSHTKPVRHIIFFVKKTELAMGDKPNRLTRLAIFSGNETTRSLLHKVVLHSSDVLVFKFLAKKSASQSDRPLSFLIHSS